MIQKNIALSNKIRESTSSGGKSRNDQSHTNWLP
jgi:hypothetical protein